MAADIVRCNHCGNWYTVSPIRREVCPFCESEAFWETHPSPTRYVLTKRDWQFLFGCQIDPEITYDEAQ